MDFTNPTGYWSFTGSYTVKLAIGANTEILPEGIVVDASTMEFTVINGRIKQSIGGIQFYDSDNIPFHFGYKVLLEIRRAAGDPIWRNRDYKPPN
jgi:hypothetical protein